MRQVCHDPHYKEITKECNIMYSYILEQVYIYRTDAVLVCLYQLFSNAKGLSNAKIILG